uniref:Uncharacterized protein n=1 Tax=Leptobrachium leishanense TaxID=445787 RepID=A0A8C5Q8K1_9ANUR
MNPLTPRDPLSQRILDLTLEMIFLLTGEGHMVVKIHEMVSDSSRHQISEGHGRSQSFNTEPPPHSGIHEQNHEKILELSNQIIRLLTGEVPIRCEDVTVYLSMEEWEYVERHKELYEDVMMEDHQPVITPGKSATYTERESLASEERHVPEKEIYPITEPPEYSPPDIKEEPASCDEGNLPDSDMYEPPEHTQTECSADNNGEYVKSNPNPVEINHSESLIESRKPDHRIYYTDPLTQNSVYKGHSASSSEMGKVSYSESDPVTREISYILEQPFCTIFNVQKSTMKPVVRQQHDYTEEHSFSCPECGKPFTDGIALKKHRRIHRGKKRFICSECGKCFTSSSHLVTHVRIHTGEKTFKCDECGKCFNQSSNLATHLRIHIGEKTFKCDECGKSFTTSSSLGSHKRIHRGEKTYICPECGKGFTRASYLAQHIRIHTGEKIFKCNDCGKSFTASSSLTRHKRTHKGDKSFTCTECGKSFTRAPYLTAHKRIHTGVKTFKCHECGKCFTQASTLARHKVIHTEEKPLH